MNVNYPEYLYIRRIVGTRNKFSFMVALGEFQIQIEIRFELRSKCDWYLPTVTFVTYC